MILPVLHALFLPVPMRNIQKDVSTPQFTGLHASSEAASKSKRRTRRRDTQPELLLRGALWRRGLRFRVDVEDLPGRPDVVFRSTQLVIFCDGDFWHGRDWKARRAKLASGANAAYWVAKIESNMARDRRIDEVLSNLGWLVLRFWETDIRDNRNEVCLRIARAIAQRKKKRLRR
jgi:DNA mismatch endonuclease (patch repair protein)